jgi:YfiH family protein
VEVAFTDRHGGVSGGPYATLNLAVSSGDSPDAVRENVRRVSSGFNGTGPVADMHQVHGADVLVADGGWQGDRPRCDGLVTVTRGVALLVRVADCVPVLLADENAGVVGAAHAGRDGLVAGVVTATLARMRALGAEQITAWVGPHICGRCYEVPAGLRDQVCAVVPQAWGETSWGTPSVDVGAGVRAQLAAEEVAMVAVDRCTREDPDLYSHRRDGATTGRFAGLVRVAP